MSIQMKALIFGAAILLLGLLPTARADSFQYDFNVPATDGQPAVNIVFTITAATLPPSGDVTSFVVTEPPDFTVTEFAWNTANSCFGSSFTGEDVSCAGFLATTGFGTTTELYVDAFPPGSFLSPGTYTGLFAKSETLVITDVSVPEPSSLLLVGFGLLGIISFGAQIRMIRRPTNCKYAAL